MVFYLVDKAVFGPPWFRLVYTQLYKSIRIGGWYQSLYKHQSVVWLNKNIYCKTIHFSQHIDRKKGQCVMHEKFNWAWKWFHHGTNKKLNFKSVYQHCCHFVLVYKWFVLSYQWSPESKWYHVYYLEFSVRNNMHCF